MPYVVEENCLCGGWTNTWSDGDDNPSVYDTEEEAEIALKYFFDDCEMAFDDGHMPDVPDPNTFRITEIKA